MEKYYLIGERLSHSYSSEIHSYFGYSYSLKEIPLEKLDSFFEKRDFNGINVTIPYKQEVMKYLDFIDEGARNIGAVNTIKNVNGRLYGYNTDILGLEYQIRNLGITLLDKKVIILGSGGTSKTAEELCKREGAKKTVVISRVGENNYSNLSKHFDADIIINTTPVGSYPLVGVSPISLEGFYRLKGIIEVIYNPLLSELSFLAKEREIPSCNGLGMLISQAKFSRDIFLGNRANDGIIEEIYKDILRKIKNVVLIGMPFSGKSVVGRALSKEIGKSFVDMDEEIEKAEGMSISELFSKRGEAYFRDKERELAEKLGKEKGQVIATGGGAVMMKDFYRIMKQNGLIVYLKRAYNGENEGRPLLEDRENYYRLLKKREKYYTDFSDIVIENDESILQTVKKITEAL